MNNIYGFISENEVCVIGCIEKFTTQKGEKQLELWLKMESWFTKLNVPVLLLSQDDDLICSKMEILYSSKLYFRHDRNNEFFEKYQVLKKKLVFGKEKTIVYPYTFLFKDGEIFQRFSGAKEDLLVQNLYILKLLLTFFAQVIQIPSFGVECRLKL